jgi:hypothetical protein
MDLFLAFKEVNISELHEHTKEPLVDAGSGAYGS